MHATERHQTPRCGLKAWLIRYLLVCVSTCSPHQPGVLQPGQAFELGDATMSYRSDYVPHCSNPLSGFLSADATRTRLDQLQGVLMSGGASDEVYQLVGPWATEPEQAPSWAVATAAKSDSPRRPRAASIRLSAIFLNFFFLVVSLPRANARFNVSAAIGDGVLQWNGRDFVYHPPQQILTTQACAEAALALVLQTHIHHRVHDNAYYLLPDHALLGGGNWPLADAEGARVAVCHTGVVSHASVAAFHSLCRYALADNDFGWPEAYDVVCDALHTADGRAVARLDSLADAIVKRSQREQGINAVAALILAAALVAGG